MPVLTRELPVADVCACVPRPDGLSEIIATFGDPRPLIGYDGLAAPAWELKHISRARLPRAMPYLHAYVNRIAVHTLLVPVVRDIFEDIDDAGLWDEIAAFRRGYTMCALPGGRGISTHAWGISIDLIPKREPIAPQIADIFIAHGFLYSTHACPPAVHFQFADGYGEL